MLEFDDALDVLLGYNELIIQLGYVILFVVAFPGAPFLAFVSNWISIRVDAEKFLFLTRRPNPQGAQDIGTWESIIKAMTCAAIVTNAALVCFLLKNVGWSTANTAYKDAMFIIFTYALFGLMVVLDLAIPDVPERVEVQLKRADFINSKIIDRVADDDDEITHTETKGDTTVKGKDDGVYYATIAASFDAKK